MPVFLLPAGECVRFFTAVLQGEANRQGLGLRKTSSSFFGSTSHSTLLINSDKCAKCSESTIDGMQ